MNISVTSTLYVNMKKDSMKLYDQQRWYHKWIEFFQHPLNQSHAGDTAWSIYRWKSLRRKYSWNHVQVATSDNRTAVISRCVCLLWQAVSESSLWETPKGSSFSKKSLGLEVWSALSSHYDIILIVRDTRSVFGGTVIELVQSSMCTADGVGK